MSPTTRQRASRRRDASTSTTILWPDAHQRRQTRPGASRPRRAPDAGPAPVEHWSCLYAPHDSAGYDLAIVQTWRLHCAGAIDWDTAGRRHHELVRLRDGWEVVR
jgi:hypothetical protein